MIMVAAVWADLTLKFRDPLAGCLSRDLSTVVGATSLSTEKSGVHVT